MYMTYVYMWTCIYSYTERVKAYGELDYDGPLYGQISRWQRLQIEHLRSRLGYTIYNDICMYISYLNPLMV